MTDLNIRSYSSADDDALISLHRRSFEGKSPQAWWNWRFIDPPRTTSYMIGAFTPQGDCVAIYAGVRQLLWINGEIRTILNQSDVAVAPEYREGLGGAALLARMTKVYFDEMRDDSLALAYGFPQPALLRFILDKTRGVVLGDLVFLARSLTDLIPVTGGVVVERVERFGEDTDELWMQCREEFGAAVVRDSIYLNWRFRDHPTVDYELLECRDADSNALRGIAVLRTGGWDPAITSLCEWLVPGADRDAGTALVARSVESARERKTGHLVTWFPTGHQLFHRFQEDYQFFAKSTPYQELFLSFVVHVDRLWLYDNWYQTMGDIDFF